MELLQATVIIQDFLREQINEETQAQNHHAALRCFEIIHLSFLLVDQELGKYSKQMHQRDVRYKMLWVKLDFKISTFT